MKSVIRLDPLIASTLESYARGIQMEKNRLPSAHRRKSYNAVCVYICAMCARCFGDAVPPHTSVRRIAYFALVQPWLAAIVFDPFGDGVLARARHLLK